MTSISALATALPPHVVRQDEAEAVARRVYAHRPELLRLLRVFAHSGVEERHTAFPAGYYLEPRSFDERNRDYVQQALLLGERAVRDCLERAGVAAADIDHFLFVTTTGLATPSVDALLCPRLGLRRDVRRLPLFGLGCAGGAGGLARACDLLRGAPGERALVLSIELCGQVFSTEATTPTDLIGAALFGDGAAAVLLGEGAGPRVRTSRTVLFDEAVRLMGWDFTSDGLRLVLSKDVTRFVGEKLRPVVETFLRDAGVRPEEVAHWVLHPGGRRILEAYEESFGLAPTALRWTRSSLSRVGNLSSASVLFILGDLLASGEARSGDVALVCALGPGFAAELLLLDC